LQQADAEVFFQFAHVGRDGRVRQTELLCRAAEAFQFGHLEEDADGIEFVHARDCA